MNVQDAITPAKAASILGVTRSRVRQFVRDGALAVAGKFGSTTVFSEAAVRELKKKRTAAGAAKKNGKGKQ